MHVAGFECGEFFYGDPGLDFSGGMLLLDGEKVKTGETFRRILLDKLPFVHGVDLSGELRQSLAYERMKGTGNSGHGDAGKQSGRGSR